MPRLRPRAATLLLALASAGCGSALDSASAVAAQLQESDAMRLALSRTSATEGELLPLTVTLTNTTNDTIAFEGNTCPHGVFEVEDAGGARIDPRIELILCAAYTKTERLAPGASFSWSVQWAAARYSPSRVNRPAGPQTVRIRARYWIAGGGLVAGQWQDVRVSPAS
jgi:hypothetical protein